ncbi:ABC transporter permease [Bifidobacterium imperatoris]|uniref:Transport permease protein n=1 Tax=Bifidobacterium imperatoris TaxID=2020965 RepID=A0A2N5IPH3_9BIFI|nr:ABC transporter permease [Bifidobacterium imperatoris]PLS23859.1 ABC-type polysaccharide/polyol phosphate export systems permease component [Bifidobacterium imperatoris]QSY58248.1 ABC transporter permease [Bifidobacterium imperatoris]
MKTIVSKLQERYRYSRIVLKEMVKTDFKLRYQGSFLGIAWSVLKPLMLFCVMYVVFVKFLKFSDGTPTFPLVLLLGIGLWNFFAEATNMGLSAIVGRGDILRKIHFPNYIIVVSATVGALISLAINMCVVLVFCIFSRVQFTWDVLWLPLNFIEFYALALGTALLLAALNVYFRDMQHIWEVLMQVFFYATPIIYPLSLVTEKTGNPIFAKVMLLSPPAQIIQDIRHNLIAPETTPTIWTQVHNWGLRSIPVVITFFILWLGIHIFRKYSQKFAEVL